MYVLETKKLVCVSVITAFFFRIYQNAMDQNIYTVCGGCVKFARDKYNFKVEIILAHAYSRMLFYDVLKPRLSSCTMLLCRTTIDLCVKKDTTFRVGYFTTISVHFFANYIYIFHKTEVQIFILRCLTSLNSNWKRSYDINHKFFRQLCFSIL